MVVGMVVGMVEDKEEGMFCLKKNFRFFLLNKKLIS
jgi:hypothetical protein